MVTIAYYNKILLKHHNLSSFSQCLVIISQSDFRTWLNLNQNRIDFNPLIRGPGGFDLLKNEVENLVGLSL